MRNKGEGAYHSTAQTLNVNRNGRQDESTGCHENKRHCGNTDQGRRKDVDPEVRLLIRCGQGTRDGSHDSQDKTREQRVFSVHVFEEFAGSHGGDESDCAHGEEAEGGVTGVEVVDLLGHQDDVVDDVLVTAVASFELLAYFRHNEGWGEHTESSNPKSGKVAQLPQRQRHDGVADILLKNYKSNQKQDCNNKQCNDEWCAPAVVTATRQHKLKEDKTRRRQDGSDIIHLRFLCDRNILGNHNGSQNTKSASNDHNQVEDISPAQGGSEETTDEKTSAEANRAGGGIDGQRPGPVQASEVGTDDSNCGRDRHRCTHSLKTTENGELDKARAETNNQCPER